VLELKGFQFFLNGIYQLPGCHRLSVFDLVPSEELTAGAAIPTVWAMTGSRFFDAGAKGDLEITQTFLCGTFPAACDVQPICGKGDCGKCMPNYSSIGGDLASSAPSNLTVPNQIKGTAERVGASLAQEFIFGMFTRRRGHVN
jgi:hypothetical protein